jgi:[acyl-carrier-protein] S-malonyltransferase
MMAFVFPGQGSQYVGMGQDFYKEFPVAKRTFEESSEVIGLDMAKLCFEAKSGDLRLTANTQPAILTVSVAAWRVLDEETGISANFLAGHSLGEYSALVASGGLDFKDAVMVARRRGEYMQNAVPDGKGAMAAIIGLSKEEIAEACIMASQDGQIASPANFNAPGQVVISGNKEAVEKACNLARSNGAKRVIPLEVSAPFHCALMNSAAERLEEVLNQVRISELKTPVVANFNAKPNRDSSKVKELLVKQVANPVRWDESVNILSESGVKEYVEIGPGNVLSGLIRRTVSNASVLNFEKTEQLNSFKQRWNSKIE